MSASENAPQGDLQTATREALTHLFDKLSYKFPVVKRDLELEHRVKEITRKWDFEERIRVHIIPALVIVVTCYGHIPNIDIRVAIVLHAALILHIDTNPSLLGTLDAPSYLRDLSAGSTQCCTGAVGELIKSVAGMWGLFPTFSANLMLVSTIQFCNACMLELESEGVVLNRNARALVEYRRKLSSAGEAYACFIWDGVTFPDPKAYMQVIPDVERYITEVNDIISYYKEELQEEPITYLRDRSSLTGRTSLETLHELVDETIATAKRIRGMLGEGAARDTWNSFEQGYISFHVYSPRYRMREILGIEYMLDMENYDDPCF